MDVKKVYGPPSLDTYDFVVQDGDELFYFTVIEKGKLLFEEALEKKGTEEYETVNKNLPERIEEKLKEYFEDKYDDNITVEK